MFFILAKVTFAIIRPVTFALLMLALGVLLMRTQFSRAGRRLVTVTVLALLLVGFTPLAPLSIAPLEDRFPLPERVEPAPDGIVILGGALDEKVNDRRPGSYALSDAAERMTIVARLAREYPDARIVFTGGTGDLLDQSFSEAAIARRLFLDFGLPEARMTFEDKSRDTWENAVFTRDLIKPAPGSRWLLVTSAFHMPRAVGIFRKVGWPGLVPYPVDYRSRGFARIRPIPDSPVQNLLIFDTAVREYLGLVAYRLAGRSDDWFPAP